MDDRTIFKHISDSAPGNKKRSTCHSKSVPPDVLLRCLEKAPERRPQGADELAAALRNCMPGDFWLPEKAREWWDTHLPRSTSKVKL